MKTICLTLIAICFSSQVFACEEGDILFPESNVCLKMEWMQVPVLNKYNSAKFTLKSSPQYLLNVIPWMVMGTGHEHGSRPVVMNNISPNEYLVEKIYFMGGMMGEWFLRLQLLNETKEVVEEIRTLIEL